MRLNGKYCCSAIDLLRFGCSKTTDSFDSSSEGLACFIKESIDVLQTWDPLSFLAHDFGDRFGMPWAFAHQTKVHRIVPFHP